MRAVTTLSLCLAAAIALCADTRGSQRDAALLKQKMATIAQAGARPATQPLRTTVTESEVNAYLVYDAVSDLPAGVVDPSVAILGPGRLSGHAVVDLDAVRKASKPTSMLDPMSYFSGRVAIMAVGTLTTSNGVGRFQLESASIGGVPVPKIVLQQIVSYYSRTPETPDGIGLDDPFALPARIREIQMQRGQAIIVQ